MGKDAGNGRFNDVEVRLRRDTANSWYFNNPILGPGQMGLEVDTNKIKIGNGITRYDSLPYFGLGPGTGSVTSVNASITSGALNVSGGPITSSGTLAFTWTGSSGQQVLGDGSLATRITNNNQLTNGAGYITSSALTGYVPYVGATSNVDIGTNVYLGKFMQMYGTIPAGVQTGFGAVNFSNSGACSATFSDENFVLYGRLLWFNSGSPVTAPYIANSFYLDSNASLMGISNTNGAGTIRHYIGTTEMARINSTGVQMFGSLTINANNIITDTTTGMRIWTSATQLGSFWGVTPIVQPTVANTSPVATYNFNGGTPLTDTDTFGTSLWTWKEAIQAIFNTGLLNP